MPNFIIVSCAICGTFQVDQEKKVKKFVCKMCGTKQSITKKIMGESENAKDLRPIVQQLNMTRGLQSQQIEPAKVQIETQQPQIHQYNQTNWDEFNDAEDQTGDWNQQKENFNDCIEDDQEQKIITDFREINPVNPKQKQQQKSQQPNTHKKTSSNIKPSQPDIVNQSSKIYPISKTIQSHTMSQSDYQHIQQMNEFDDILHSKPKKISRDEWDQFNDEDEDEGNRNKSNSSINQQEQYYNKRKRISEDQPNGDQLNINDGLIVFGDDEV